MNALGLVIESWGQKTPAEIAANKLEAAQKATTDLETAQANLVAAQTAAEKAKREAEEAVNRLGPQTFDAAPTAASDSTPVESDDAHIARIVAETLISLGVIPQANQSAAEAAEVANNKPTTTLPDGGELQVTKPAEELGLSPAPAAGAPAAHGGNYPAKPNNKKRR